MLVFDDPELIDLMQVRLYAQLLQAEMSGVHHLEDRSISVGNDVIIIVVSCINILFIYS